MRTSVVVLVALCAVVLTASVARAEFRHRNMPADWTPTPLQQFAAADDGVFAWSLVGKFRNQQSTTYYLNVTTCKWLTAAYSSRPLWWSIVGVTVPDQVAPEMVNYTGIYIDGGSNTDSLPDHFQDTFAISISETINITFAHLFQVPNQGISFDGPNGPYLGEDSLVARAWYNAIQDPATPAKNVYFPMVKSVTKVMDAMQLFLGTLKMTVPQNFIMTGASKRGWTAVDDRVVAIAPLVMPSANITADVNLLWRSQGGWPFVMEPYYQQNITAYLNTPQWDNLMRQFDPLVYFPFIYPVNKWIVVACADEFLPPDSPRNWYNLLSSKSETHLRLVPDADHMLLPMADVVVDDFVSFAYHVAVNRPRPQIQQTITYSNTTATIWAMPSQKPTQVKLWHATTWSPSFRDFKFERCLDSPTCFQPNFWFDKDITNQAGPDGSYSASYNAPRAGWIGFVIVFTFEVNDFVPDFQISTQLNIVPDRLPFPTFVPPQ